MHAGLLPSGSAINRDPPACFHVVWGGTSIGCTGNLLFQICLRTWGPLFKECRSSTQKINNNKQCRCLALCAPLGGLGFSPHLSHPTGDAPKQRNKQRIAMLVSAAASSCCCHSFCELDDEAFGYLKRVIVTPAVDSRLIEFLHYNIQSTEQKSHCVKNLFDSSQCFVLIKQSGSPC